MGKGKPRGGRKLAVRVTYEGSRLSADCPSIRAPRSCRTRRHKGHRGLDRGSRQSATCSKEVSMSPLEAAFYARVSGEQQANAQTIQSQIAALRERIACDDVFVPPDREFVDDGYSGATLVRPALERLRDFAAAGAIQRIYVHSPDRLARSYAYQVVLLDEWRRYAIEVVFLNKAIGQSPEDGLLLQVQGVVAEYERSTATLKASSTRMSSRFGFAVRRTARRTSKGDCNPTPI